MHRGVTLENPYASVDIPRAQFQQSFITRYLEDEPSSATVIANPAAVPTYRPEEQNPAANTASWNSPTISTEKSWSQPYNPYASLKMLNRTSPDSFYTVNLDKPSNAPEHKVDGGNCCYKYCPCCKKCCCVIS
ncbi:PREDICTED: cysteine-rich tail protein 1-like [Tinamus guttatus]|uniref:cysteine-rich tail protein 1-like n=1 Tax=Tinamus guttatus TaxID=94827 RepID=UPI00052EA2D9|nr:PREDICTED: cysteine-rich tail protein 1-like [Tinamus guttatus]